MWKWFVDENMPCRWYFFIPIRVSTVILLAQSSSETGVPVTLPHGSLCKVATSPLQCLSCNASSWWPWTRKPTQDTFCVASGIHLNWPRRRKKGEEEEGEDAAKATWRVSHSRLALPELCRGLTIAENAGKMPANFRGSTLVGQQPRENEQLWFPSKQHMLFAGLFRTAVG